MSVIWTEGRTYQLEPYDTEREFEAAIREVHESLFGSNRIYLDIKRKIGSAGGTRNIPDGYLIDLSGRNPRLFVVENELSRHDPLRHIAIQILQFSLSFESEHRLVRQILLQALQDRADALSRCEQYARDHGFRNLDHFLDHLVAEVPFSALVIIDQAPDELETILTERFAFGVEVLQLARYKDHNGGWAYHFKPFLADVQADVRPDGSSQPGDLSEVDTIVVPAREDGFVETFLGENRWYAMRISGTMRPQIRYIAAYRVAPTSAITHIAPVRSIKPWKDSGKYLVNFAQPARPIGPIGLKKSGRVKAPQSPRYTVRRLLEGAKTLDDLWG